MSDEGLAGCSEQRPYTGDGGRSEQRPYDAVDYLLVGHVCLDEVPGGTRLGGTVAYAARAAQQLGRRVGIVTSAAADFDLGARLPGVAVHRVDAAATTRFRNVYVGGARRQTLLARAADLTLADVPAPWRAAPLVHLAPVAQEVDRGLARALAGPGRFVGATPQGWLRGWDAAGAVRPVPTDDLGAALAAVDALALSEEDLAGAASPWLDGSGRTLGAVTRGARGVRLRRGAWAADVAACPARVCDPTGAGDVFAAVWFVRLAAGDDAVAAARYAACAAACAVEQPGLAGIPTAAQIEERLAQWAA